MWAALEPTQSPPILPNLRAFRILGQHNLVGQFNGVCPIVLQSQVVQVSITVVQYARILVVIDATVQVHFSEHTGKLVHNVFSAQVGAKVIVETVCTVQCNVDCEQCCDVENQPATIWHCATIKLRVR